MALAALRQGGVNITRKELLQKVSDGGIARRSSDEQKQVQKYEKARITGKAAIQAAISATNLPSDNEDVIILTQQWKSIGETLLKGVSYNDIFTAEAAVVALAKRMMEALTRVRRLARKRPSTALQQ